MMPMQYILHRKVSRLQVGGPAGPGEHPDGRRKGVRQMIEHGNSSVSGWPKLKPSLCHLTEVMNPLLWQMTEAWFRIFFAFLLTLYIILIGGFKARTYSSIRK